MAVPGSCNLTQTERNELDAWSFTRSYRKHRRDLLDLAKALYRTLSNASNNQGPTQGEFCKAYGDSLKLTNLYVQKIATKKVYLPLSLHDHFADLLAKYAVDQDWPFISNP